MKYDLTFQNDSDIRLSGHVSWVGRSSVEIVVWLEQKVEDRWRKLTRALFLMACRNATNTAAAIVNPLQPANEEEKKIHLGGESETLIRITIWINSNIIFSISDRKRQRIQLQKESIFNQGPSAFEQKLIHNIFMKTMDLNDNAFNVRKIPKGKWTFRDTWNETVSVSVSAVLIRFQNLATNILELSWIQEQTEKFRIETASSWKENSWIYFVTKDYFNSFQALFGWNRLVRQRQFVIFIVFEYFVASNFYSARFQT